MNETEQATERSSFNVPANYEEVLYWKITDKPGRILLMNLLSLPLFAVAGVIFLGLAGTVGRMPGNYRLGLLESLLIIASFILILVLHELAHGIVMQIFGARPQYGVMWSKGMFYATAPGHGFRRNPYLAIALAPLVLLSILSVLGMALFSGASWVGILALAATVNAAGAIGDLWISTIVLRYPSNAVVVDEKDGMRIFLPERAG